MKLHGDSFEELNRLLLQKEDREGNPINHDQLNKFLREWEISNPGTKE